MRGTPPAWARFTGFSRTANVVTVTAALPVAPLVFDEVTVPAQAAKGFVLSNAPGVTITSVAIASATTIEVTLSATPPAGATLTYAFEGPGNGGVGPVAGAWGNVRDSSAVASTNVPGAVLYNFVSQWRATIA
jgi:hypothetical protein